MGRLAGRSLRVGGCGGVAAAAAVASAAPSGGDSPTGAQVVGTGLLAGVESSWGLWPPVLQWLRASGEGAPVRVGDASVWGWSANGSSFSLTIRPGMEQCSLARGTVRVCRCLRSCRRSAARARPERGTTPLGERGGALHHVGHGNPQGPASLLVPSFLDGRW